MATYLRPNRSKERILLFEVNKNEENIEIFAEAMRQGKPTGECFYYPCFSRSSGGVFSFNNYVSGSAYSSVGARLRVPDGKTATHMGKIMLVHYKIMDKG